MDRPYVFVSYAREDRQYVNQLMSVLEAADVGVWVDHEIDYGDRWADVIRARIDGCAAMIVVMSPAAEASTWVAREIARAEHMGKRILPLLVNGLVFFSLGNLHYENVLDGRMPSAAFFGRVAVAVDSTAKVEKAFARAQPRFLISAVYDTVGDLAVSSVISGVLADHGVRCVGFTLPPVSADLQRVELRSVEAVVVITGDRISHLAEVAPEVIAGNSFVRPKRVLVSMYNMSLELRSHAFDLEYDAVIERVDFNGFSRLLNILRA